MCVDLDFAEQEPIPQAAAERVEALLASGKLFRYGEHGANEADEALLEADFLPHSSADASVWHSTAVAPRLRLRSWRPGSLATSASC